MIYTQLRNAITVSSSPSMTTGDLTVISQFDYTYDAAGRRISIAKSGSAFALDDTVSYGYNARSELTNAVAAVDANYRYGYQYDPIGNRETSAECGTNMTYSANELNQYTQIAAESEDAFVSEFDDDGNQTLVKTATGVWRVTYNGENRPIRWEQIEQSNNPNNRTILQMSYDHMGRRREKNAQHFFYDGYLQIANFHSPTPTQNSNYFSWDPTESVATRPLAWNLSTIQPFNHSTSYYTHDGNKNVSEVIAADGDLAAHYDYAPFGALIVSCGTGDSVNNAEPIHSSLLPVRCLNPWRFSSEFADDELGCDYYNYREYEPVAGRWMARDLIDESKEYCFVANTIMSSFDVLGAYGNPISGPDGPLSPASPYDPGGYLSPTELRADCDHLELELSLMCPVVESHVKTAWHSCCCGLNCRAQAKQVANSVYETVTKMRRDVIAGGWLGNLFSSIGYGYKCVEWQKAIADAVNDAYDAEYSCFKGIGVGVFYPFTKITRHNWVKIFGPNTKNLLTPAIKNEGIEVDPWPSGGRNIFPGSFPDVDAPTYWIE